MSNQALTFFDLPRELRDDIYNLLATRAPRDGGPLKGYADLPSPSLLAVSRRLRAEYLPIFRKSLTNVITQDRVCFYLGRSNKPGYSYYACWNIWRIKNHRSKFTLWTRHGKSTDNYAAWWCDTVVPEWSPSPRELNTSGLQTSAFQAAHRFSEVLQKMIWLEKVYDIPIGLRLMNVYCRVRKVIVDGYLSDALNDQTDFWSLARRRSALAAGRSAGKSLRSV